MIIPKEALSPPHVTPELLEYMETVWPLSQFKETSSLEVLHRLQGIHSMIDHFKALALTQTR